VLSIFVENLRLDEKLVLSLALIAVVTLVHAFSYTTAEGALPAQRLLFRRGADLLALVAAYVVLRLWI